MYDLLYCRGSYGEYIQAIRRVRRALRRGSIDEVKAWVALAERLLRIQTCHDALRFNGDKRQALREERPHRLKLLEHRVRFPR